jgi:RNA polymerase-associated protein CTR9
MEELHQQAKLLAQERRAAREQALEWSREVKLESEEERERKSKKSIRRVKTEGGSGDEGIEPKKKKRGKVKKEEGEDQALFSDEEDGEKPAKKVASDSD